MSTFSHDIDPPGALEDRVVDALRARGLIRPPASRRSSRARVAAAAIVVFLSGFAAGSWQWPDRAPSSGGSPRFVLLLHDGTGPAGQTSEHTRVEEYRAWARSVRAAGHAIEGEKLKKEPDQSLSGYFIVEAPSLDAARALAASCPHARLGGRIEIREIDPT
jgi:hypothetical protein